MFILKKRMTNFSPGQFSGGAKAKKPSCSGGYSAAGSLRLQDERACPGVGRDWIQTLLADWKSNGRMACTGRGPAARWHLITDDKGTTPN